MVTSETLRTSTTFRSTSTSEERDDDDAMSVATLKDEDFKDEISTRQIEMKKAMKLAQSREVMAIAAERIDPHLHSEELRKQYDQFTRSILHYDSSEGAMIKGIETVFEYQNIEGREVDFICEIYEKILNNGLANAAKFTSRINKLNSLRDLTREEYETTLSKYRDEYQNKLNDEKKRSKKEEDKINDEVKKLSNQKELKKNLKGTVGLLKSEKKRR